MSERPKHRILDYPKICPFLNGECNGDLCPSYQETIFSVPDNIDAVILQKPAERTTFGTKMVPPMEYRLVTRFRRFIQPSCRVLNGSYNKAFGGIPVPVADKVTEEQDVDPYWELSNGIRSGLKVVDSLPDPVQWAKQLKEAKP